MRQKYFIIVLCSALFLINAAAAYAMDLAVIVNKNNGNEVTKDMVEKIYKGDLISWSAGGAIVPLDQPEDSEERASFCSTLLGKSVSKMKALWTMKLFSGKATPPKVVNSDAEMTNLVATNKNAIGYIKASSLDNSVKAVLTLK